MTDYAVNAIAMPHEKRRKLVASRIRKARLDSGLSQRDVASILQTSQASYCRMEAAMAEPSAVQLATLSGTYGVSVLWLLGYPNFIALALPQSSSGPNLI